MAVSKADNIMENMNKSAKHLAEQTLNGAQKRLSDALEKAEKRLKIETDNLKRQRISEINAASGVKISAAENEARAGLFKRREEVRLEVFEEARKRIGEFTQTEKYKDLLIASAKRIREQMEGRVRRAYHQRSRQKICRRNMLLSRQFHNPSHRQFHRARRNNRQVEKRRNDDRRHP